MRIAIVGSRGMGGSYSGIERVLLKVCPRLAALGHEVDVFGDGKQSDLDLPDGVREIYCPAIAGKYTETLTRSAYGTVASLLRSYDVLNLTAIGPGGFSPVAHLFGMPVVVSVHGLDWARDKWPLPARLALKGAERIIVGSADQITAVSKQLVRYFRENYNREVIHTPNGVDRNNKLPDRDLLKSMGLAPDAYILFASRLVKEKAAHELIAAFNQVDTNMTLVIAGGDRYDKAYVASLRSLDRTGRCVFTGHLEGDRLEHVFRGAALYVLPSHIEGLSLSLLEAVGHGKPIVVSDIPENLEVAGDAAVAFRVGDVAGLAAALHTVLDNSQLRARLAADVGERAASLYSWDLVAQRYLEAYERAIDRRGSHKGRRLKSGTSD
jgi:glycosyltransferase involved in cell wall biosynthesis